MVTACSRVVAGCVDDTEFISALGVILPPQPLPGRRRPR